jgi:hypothetical protein
MSKWLPGVALLSAMVGIGALLGAGLGAAAWPLFALLACGGLSVLAWLTRARMRSRPPAAPRSRTRAPKAEEDAYDLEADDSTDEQRWLM